MHEPASPELRGVAGHAARGAAALLALAALAIIGAAYRFGAGGAATGGVARAAELLPPLALALAALPLLALRPRDPAAPLLAAAFALGAAAMAWGGWAAPLVPQAPTIGVALGAAAMTSALLALAGFPDGRFAGAGVATLLLAAPALGGGYAVVRLVPGAAVPEASLLAGIAGVLLCAAVALAVRLARPLSPVARQQVKFALGGFVLAALLAIPLFAALVPGVPSPIAPPPVAWHAVLLAPALALTAAQLRFRLFDIDAAFAAIARTAVFLSVTALLFVVAARALMVLLRDVAGAAGDGAALSIAAVLTAVLAAPIHARAARWADERFRGPLRQLTREVPALVGELRQTANLHALGDAVVAWVTYGTASTRALLVVANEAVAERGILREPLDEWRAIWRVPPEPGLHCEPADAYLPVRVPLAAPGCGHIGWLLLGPRPDGTMPGRAERRALADITVPVTRALAIVREREAWHLSFDARLGKLELVLAELAGSDYASSALH